MPSALTPHSKILHIKYDPLAALTGSCVQAAHLQNWRLLGRPGLQQGGSALWRRASRLCDSRAVIR